MTGGDLQYKLVLSADATRWTAGVRDASGALQQVARDAGSTSGQIGTAATGIERAAGQISGALNTARAQGSAALEGLASRAGPLGGMLTALGPAGLTAAAGIGAVAVVLKQALGVAREFEQAGLKTEAVLKATSGASAQTTESIRQMSREIALSTLASVRGVEQAAQMLLTFRSVSGDTFRRTLELSQDLAAVGFGSIESAAVQLGKALENPEQGLSALTEVGVSFTAEQKELIKTLVATGEELKAQELILDAVQQQVGGAGAGEAGGLSGAVDTLGQRWEEFLEVVADRANVLDNATGIVNTLAAALAGLNEALSIEGDLRAIDAQLAYHESTIGRIIAAPGDLLGEAFGLGSSTEMMIEGLKRRRAELEREAATKAALRDIDQQRADIVGRHEQAERRLAAARGQVNAITEEALTTEQKAAKLLAERERAIEGFTKAGGDAAAADAARAAARRAYDEAVAKGSQASVKAADQEAKAWDQSLAALIAKHDKMAAAQAEFEAGLTLADEALARGRISAEQYDTVLASLVDSYAAVATGADKAGQRIAQVQERIAEQLRYQLEELALRQAYEGDTTGELEVQVELLRLRRQLEADGVKDAAAVAKAYEGHVRQLVGGNRRLAEQQRYLQEVARVAEQISGDVAEALWDSLTDERRGQSAIEFFRSWAKRLGVELLKTHLVLRITTQIVGAVPGLFGIASPAAGASGSGSAAAGAAGGFDFGSILRGGNGALSPGLDAWAARTLGWGAITPAVSSVSSAAPVAVAANGMLAGGEGARWAVQAPGLLNGGSATAGFASFSNVLGIAGSVLPGLLSGNFGQAAAGGIGAAIGTAILPGIGTAIGGALGNLAGSLLGGKKNPHPAFHSSLGAQGGEAGYFGLTDWSQKHLDDDTPQKVGAALAEAANAAMAGLLGGDARVIGGDRFALSYDEKKKRYAVHGEGGVMLSEHGENMEAAVADLIFRAIKSGDYEGVGEDIATAIGNSVATNLDALAADLEFVRGRDTMFDAARVIGEVEGATAALIGTYDAAVAKAEQLGVSTDGMTRSFQGALKRMAEGTATAGPFATAMADLVAAMGLAAEAAGDAAAEVVSAWAGAVRRLRTDLHQQVALGLLDQLDPRSAAIFRARQDVAAMRAEFEAVGGDPELLRWYEQVTMARAEETGAIADQIALLDTVAASWRRVEGAVVRFRDHLLGSADLYPGSPEDRYRTAMAEFQAALLAAQTDPEQAARVEDLARIAAEASLAFNGATLAYAQDIALIEAGLQGLETVAMRELRAAEDAVTELRGANQWLGAIEAALKALGMQQSRNYGANPALNKEIAAVLPGFTGDFGAGALNAYMQTASAAEIAAVNAVLQRHGIGTMFGGGAATRDYGANPSLNQQIAAVLPGFTGDFGAGALGAYMQGASQSEKDRVNALLAANGISGRFQRGGIVGSYESGGVVANGIWNADSVIARYGNGGAIMLAGGEHITRATSVTPETLPVLDAINHTGRLPTIHAPAPSNDLAPLVRRLDRMAAQTDRLVELTAAAVTEAAQARRQLELARADTAAARAEAWQQRATGSYGR